MLALPPRAKKKPPAQQMQQDQQQVASPVALQMQKQPVQQQGAPAKPPGAPPSPPRETPSPQGSMMQAMGGPGAAPSGGFMGGSKIVRGPQGFSPGSPKGAEAIRPDRIKAIEDNNLGLSLWTEQAQQEYDRQQEIERQKQLEAERIGAEEAAREEEARRQQREESVFDDVNKNVSNDTLDQQIRGLIENLVSGKGASTESEEALIKQLMEDRIGAGLVEQRARMGRAGFGASGALAAMEGDVRRQAAQGATQETLAIRRQAEQDAINRALEAIGVDVEKRKQASEDIFQEEYLNALKSALGQSVEPVGGGGGGNIIDEAINAVGRTGKAIGDQLGWGDETQLAAAPERTPEEEEALYGVGGKYNPISVNTNEPPPENATQIYKRPDGGVQYAVEENGKTVWYIHYKYATK